MGVFSNDLFLPCLPVIDKRFFTITSTKNNSQIRKHLSVDIILHHFYTKHLIQGVQEFLIIALEVNPEVFVSCWQSLITPFIYRL